jgi:hypothetical protein
LNERRFFSTTSPRPCSPNATHSLEQELQDLWASAYDGWIDVPGGGGEKTIYTRPEGSVPAAKDSPSPSLSPSSPSPSSPSPSRSPTPTPSPSPPPAFPPIVAASRLFALTGFNPMGEDRPIAENRAANARLAAEVGGALIRFTYFCLVCAYCN